MLVARHSPVGRALPEPHARGPIPLGRQPRQCGTAAGQQSQSPSQRRRSSWGGWQPRPCAASAVAAAAAGSSVQQQQAVEQHQHEDASALLDWLVRWQGATPACPKVERRYAGEGLGWCLVATVDIEPEEVRQLIDWEIADLYSS